MTLNDLIKAMQEEWRLSGKKNDEDDVSDGEDEETKAEKSLSAVVNSN